MTEHAVAQSSNNPHGAGSAGGAKIIRPKINKLMTAIAVLSFVAMGVTAYLTYLHFEPAASGFCNFGDQWNCEIVNKSQWSVIDLGFVEIPVAIMGFFTYLFLFLGSLGVLKRWKFTKIHKVLREGLVIKLLSYLTYVGVVFSLYLSYIEAFKLQTFCLFCVIQQIIILVIMVLFIVTGSMINKQKNDGKVCEFC